MTNKYIEEVKKELNDLKFTIEDSSLKDCVVYHTSVETLFEQALLKQREMIMECLPKNKGKKGWVEFTFRTETGERKQRQSVETNYDLGWNECNQQFLDNIKDKGI